MATPIPAPEPQSAGVPAGSAVAPQIAEDRKRWEKPNLGLWGQRLGVSILNMGPPHNNLKLLVCILAIGAP